MKSVSCLFQGCGNKIHLSRGNSRARCNSSTFDPPVCPYTGLVGHLLLLGVVSLVQNSQTLGDGELGQTRDAVDIQLAYDALAMGFHGANADAESARNFFIAEAFGDVNQNFTLAIG